jgi:hypothetical protein
MPHEMVSGYALLMMIKASMRFASEPCAMSGSATLEEKEMRFIASWK